MDNGVVVAIVSLIGTSVGTLGGILTASKLTNYRIQELEKKVEKHNKVVDRVYKLEQHKAGVDEEIKVINHRINDLEEYHK